jgi:hypothetical protein
VELNELRSDETIPGGHARIKRKTTMKTTLLTFAAVLGVGLGTASLTPAAQTATLSPQEPINVSGCG